MVFPLCNHCFRPNALGLFCMSILSMLLPFLFLGCKGRKSERYESSPLFFFGENGQKSRASYIVLVQSIDFCHRFGTDRFTDSTLVLIIVRAVWFSQMNEASICQISSPLTIRMLLIGSVFGYYRSIVCFSSGPNRFDSCARSIRTYERPLI